MGKNDIGLQEDCIMYNRNDHDCIGLSQLYCETEDKPCPFKKTKEDKEKYEQKARMRNERQ